MSGNDLRPWLIISKREAEALSKAALLSHDLLWDDHIYIQDLNRALRVVEQQLAFISSGGMDGEAPSIQETIKREAEAPTVCACLATPHIPPQA